MQNVPLYLRRKNVFQSEVDRHNRIYTPQVSCEDCYEEQQWHIFDAGEQNKPMYRE